MILLALLLLSSLSFGQSLNGGSIARAGVHDLRLKSSEALAFNAAILGSIRSNKYCIEFLNSGFAVVNNSFSTAYWNQNIAGDRFLNEHDKRELLDHMGDEGISFDGRATLPIVGMSYKHFALRIALDSYGSGLIPRDAAEVLLLGNALGKEYSVNALRGEAASFLDVGIGIGHAFEQEWIQTLSIGVAAHYYQGLHMSKLTQTAGIFSVTDSLISGSAYLRSVESTNGDGVGFDLGMLAEINDKWAAGISVRQIGVKPSWTIKTNRILSGEIDSAGITIDSLDQDGYLDRVFQSQDTSYAGGFIDTPLPAVLIAGGKYSHDKNKSALAEFTYISRGAPTDKAEISLGLASQWRANRWLELQNGLTVGSLWRTQVGLGGGLRFNKYEFDLGWSWNGGLFNHAKGISFGMSHRIMF